MKFLHAKATITKENVLRLDIYALENTPHFEVEMTIREARTLLNDIKDAIKKYESIQKNTFVINDHITLKLEDNKTMIYIDGEPFEQCKFLLLSVPKEHSEDYDVKSIDEASETLGMGLHGVYDIDQNILSPEEEFQGHCSNIQAWVEHGYDTKLMHRNLAFPLLKRLTEVGDLVANRKFKDEIADRLEQGELNVFVYLWRGGFLQDFSTDELEIIFSNIKDPFTKLFVLTYYPDYLNSYSNSNYTEDQLLKYYKSKYVGLENDNIKVTSHDNELLKKITYNAKYSVEKSITDKIKCSLLQNKYLDFFVPTKKYRIVYEKKHIDKVKEIFNYPNDITISIPNKFGPIILKSKKANLKAYISPLILK